MADLAVDRATPKRCIRGCIQVPVYANTKIYAGVIVAINSSGYAVNAPNASGARVVGVSKAQVDNTTATGGAGLSGSKSVEVEWGIFEFDASSIAVTDVGAPMHAIDNHTIDETYATNDIQCGVLVRFISATKGEVLIDQISLG
jgi:hypothetical protein